MRILYIGDIFGLPGRIAISRELPSLRAQLKPDFIIANGENVTHGLGLSIPHAKLLIKAGVDGFVLGNHAFDQKDLIPAISPGGEFEGCICRAANFIPGTPGPSFLKIERNSLRLAVIQVEGRAFMPHLVLDPLSVIEELLPHFSWAHGIIIDVHAEATAEKAVIALSLDGKVGAVVGTHTHVPTADARILPQGTAFMTDVGMTGVINSSVGVKIETPRRRLAGHVLAGRLEPAEGVADLCGVLIDLDPSSGKALHITPVRTGPTLSPTVFPNFESSHE